MKYPFSWALIVTVCAMLPLGCGDHETPRSHSDRRSADMDGKPADEPPGEETAPAPDPELMAAVTQRVEQLGGQIEFGATGVPIAIELPDEAPATDGDLELFAQLTKLKRIRVHSPQITDAGVGHLAALTALTHLQVLFAPITDDALQCVKSMPELQVVDFRGCAQVGDHGVEHLLGLSGLKTLKLQSSLVSDVSLDRLTKFSNLRSLALEQSCVTDQGLAKLSSFPDLVELSLMECGTYTDAGLVHLAPLKKLRQLNLRWTNIDGSGLASIAGRTTLEHLDLSQTQANDAALGHIAGCTGLQRLNLWYTNISDAGLKHLEGLADLNWLNLDNTRITDEGVASLAGLTRLEDLNLRQTDISDAALSHLAGLKNLKKLDASVTFDVTGEGVKRLQDTLPECEIEH